MNDIDDFVIDFLYQNRHDLGLVGNVESYYSKQIRYNKNSHSYPPTLKLKIFKGITKIRNIDDTELEFSSSVRPGSKAKAYIKCNGLWIFNNKFGMSWKVMKLVSKPSGNRKILESTKPEPISTSMPLIPVSTSSIVGISPKSLNGSTGLSSLPSHIIVESSVDNMDHNNIGHDNIGYDNILTEPIIENDIENEIENDIENDIENKVMEVEDISRYIFEDYNKEFITGGHTLTAEEENLIQNMETEIEELERNRNYELKHNYMINIEKELAEQRDNEIVDPEEVQYLIDHCSHRKEHLEAHLEAHPEAYQKVD